MNVICGADGCRAGWVVISKELDTNSVSWRLFRMVCELVYAQPSPVDRSARHSHWTTGGRATFL